MPGTLLNPIRDNLALSPPNQADMMIQLYNNGAGHLVLPVTVATADAAVLFTVPTGYRMRILSAFWEVTLGWTGGASSAIGLSSSNAAFNTKGDLLGAAAGDLAAVLIVASPGPFVGAVGTKLTSQKIVVLNAADTIRFDRITSLYTAGTGNAHVAFQLFPTT